MKHSRATVMICHEDYPTSVVVVDIVEVLAAVSIGLVIIAEFGLWAVLAYALVGLLAVVLSLASVCTRCYYYDRVCGTGLGKIAAFIFKKRDEEELGKSLWQTLSWTLLGVLLLLPIVAGLIALRERFDVPRLLWLVAFLGLMAAITVTHSRFVCNRCQERKAGRCTLGRLEKPFDS